MLEHGTLLARAGGADGRRLVELVLRLDLEPALVVARRLLQAPFSLARRRTGGSFGVVTPELPSPSVARTPLPLPLRIAIVGAESSGKTTLAAELARALAADARIAPARVALVPELLREWCAARGRTPRPEEQRGILVEQHRRIEAAAGAHDIVVCDTTALMTHVYSDLLFGDRSLLDAAIERHRTMAATLLTALDLPWVADGIQRDGEHVRRPVDDRLRELLLRHGFAFSVIAGHGGARLSRALAALQPVLAARQPGRPADGRPAGAAGAAGAAAAAAAATAAAAAAAAAGTPPVSTPARGLFSRLQAERSGHATGDTGPAASRRRAWLCDCCVPAAERALLRLRAEGRAHDGGAADLRSGGARSRPTA